MNATRNQQQRSEIFPHQTKVQVMPNARGAARAHGPAGTNANLLGRDTLELERLVGGGTQRVGRERRVQAGAPEQ